MAFRAIDLSNPYCYLFLFGFFAGFGFGRLPFLYGRKHPLRRLGSGGMIFVCSAFSLSVLAAAAAVFATSGGLFSETPVDLSLLKEQDWIWLAGISAFIGLVARRFPKSGGIPLLLAAGFLVFFVSNVFTSWFCYTPGETILGVRVAAESDVSIVKFTFPPDRELLTTIEGRGILPVVETVTCSPAFCFLGKGRLYRINGLDIGEPRGTVPFVSPDVKGSYWGDVFVSVVRKVSLFKYYENHLENEYPGVNEKFSLSIDDDGRLVFNTEMPF